VAAPVVGSAGGAIGVLYLYGPSYRFPPSGTAASQLASALLDRAEQLSTELGVRS